ncbi:retinol dehydrogenase 10-B-like [Megalops cyprinoides]|uniref:retinol dehydrogenase 10-B-like n=1 Tax=Megalops cyprinoides TaxID=118141 RepID=UPI0018649615|nr:retinol dehydrogenase 10-B-like [Megalops cyprinoides]
MIVLVDLLLMVFDVTYCILRGIVTTFLRPRLKPIDGELCLITGAGGALGRLFALEFAKEGAELVLWDCNTEANEQTAKLVRELGVKAHPYTVDLTSRENIYKMADLLRHEVGDITMLVNNAGVVAGRRLLDCPDALLERTMVVNCHALFWMTKAFLPQMKAQNHGHIVTIASTLGLFSTACVEDYCASKFGAVGFHESLTHELLTEEGLDGVKTTLVCPYIVDTGMFAGCKIREELQSFIPPLEPLDCVQQAMNAILADQPMVCIPRVMYLPFLSRALLPWDANVLTYRFMGADKCMYPFIQTMEQRQANGLTKMS